MPDQAPLPDFELPVTGNQRFRLSAFNGQPLVPCFFYPRDKVKVPGHAQAVLDFVKSAAI